MTEAEKKMATEAGITLQPSPKGGCGPSMHDLAAEEIAKRKKFGLLKYNSLLQTNNGRDFLTDSIEEVADLLAYLCGAREEAKQEKPLSVADKMKQCEEEYAEYARITSELKMTRLANEGHLRTIETQGEKIAGYKRRNDALTNSRNAYMNRCEDLEESLSQESKASDTAKVERDELRTQYADAVSELGDAREANVELRVELARYRNGVQASSATVDEMLTLLNLARGANGRFHQRYLDQQRTITELQRKVGSFDQVEAAYQNRIERLTETSNRRDKAAYLRLEHVRRLEKTIVDAMDKSAPYALKAYDTATEREQ